MPKKHDRRHKGPKFPSSETPHPASGRAKEFSPPARQEIRTPKPGSRKDRQTTDSSDGHRSPRLPHGEKPRGSGAHDVPAKPDAKSRRRGRGRPTGECEGVGGIPAAASPCSRSRGEDDIREALFNGAECGPANKIAIPRDEVAAITGFLIDVDNKLLDPEVIGRESADSPDVLYEVHVRHWLDRDRVLSRAEVRNTGGGLHVILWLNEPLLCEPDQQQLWDDIAKGIRLALPGDPKVLGINAMTRPVGELNRKYDPPREVRVLRRGSAVSRNDVLDLVDRLEKNAAAVRMNMFFGGERTSPCPLCLGDGTSLGIAGGHTVRCYHCGNQPAFKLLMRFYADAFVSPNKEVVHG